MRDRGLTKADAHCVELLEVTVGEIREPLTQVFDGLGHPLLLVIGSSLQDAATIDVAE
jgi:hypothetical protein